YLHAGQEERGLPERQLADTLDLTRRTKFLGFVRDVVPLLRCADAFVMTSVREGFSIAAMEALGAGVPVVLTDVPGLQDLKGLVEGIFWAGLDAASVGAAISRIRLLRPHERDRITQTTSRKMSTAFSAAAAAHSLLALYRDDQTSNVNT